MKLCDFFLFLIDLAWKSRVTLPLIVSTAIIFLDIRPELHIQIHTDEYDDDSDSDSGSYSEDWLFNESGEDEEEEYYDGFLEYGFSEVDD